VSQFILPYIDSHLLKASKFLTSDHQNPIDYLLFCEMNTTLRLLGKAIDPDTFPKIHIWRDTIAGLPEAMLIRDIY